MNQSKPLALDLFCGGGGACEGLMRAGFEVVGVDIVAKHAKNYPGTFVHGDACNPPFNLSDFDFVWASPPCQHFSQAFDSMPHLRLKHPNLIPQTRALLKEHPYTVIENVPRAPIRPDIVLTGAAFGLKIHRERRFEVCGFKVPLFLLQEWKGMTVSNGDLACVAGNGANNAWNLTHGKKWTDLPDDLRTRLKERNSAAGWLDAMGIEHYMTRDEVKESVPPAYAEWIGHQVMQRLS